MLHYLGLDCGLLEFFIYSTYLMSFSRPMVPLSCRSNLAGSALEDVQYKVLRKRGRGEEGVSTYCISTYLLYKD